jgi:hypothetical protein
MLRPQCPKAIQNEGSRETPPNQIHVETACPLPGGVPLAALPVLPGELVDDRLLGDVLQGFGDARLRGAGRDPTLLELLGEPAPAQAAVSQAGAGEADGEALVVEVALLAQALDGGVDLGGVELLPPQGPPQLALRVVASGELVEGALIGRLG